MIAESKHNQPKVQPKGKKEHLEGMIFAYLSVKKKKKQNKKTIVGLLQTTI